MPTGTRNRVFCGADVRTANELPTRSSRGRVLKLPADVESYLSLKHCDVRRQVDGLAALVRSCMERRVATWHRDLSVEHGNPVHASGLDSSAPVSHTWARLPSRPRSMRARPRRRHRHRTQGRHEQRHSRQEGSTLVLSGTLSPKVTKLQRFRCTRKESSRSSSAPSASTAAPGVAPCLPRLRVSLGAVHESHAERRWRTDSRSFSKKCGADWRSAELRLRPARPMTREGTGRANGAQTLGAS